MTLLDELPPDVRERFEQLPELVEQARTDYEAGKDLAARHLMHHVGSTPNSQAALQLALAAAGAAVHHRERWRALHEEYRAHPLFEEGLHPTSDEQPTAAPEDSKAMPSARPA